MEKTLTDRLIDARVGVLSLVSGAFTMQVEIQPT